MSKESEAFNRVSESLLHAVGGIGNAHYIDYSNSAELAKEDLDIIETILKDYGQYKIIEEELGIDLVTLYKALKNGIYIKPNNIYCGSPYLCYSENEHRKLEMQFRVADVWYKVKDYGKTWALTKEELLWIKAQKK